jgi:hypothetical protein
VTFGEEVSPACESRGHEPAVDVVERLSVGPVIFDIFDHEAEIRRNADLVSKGSIESEQDWRHTKQAEWEIDQHRSPKRSILVATNLTSKRLLT